MLFPASFFCTGVFFRSTPEGTELIRVTGHQLDLRPAFLQWAGIRKAPHGTTTLKGVARQTPRCALELDMRSYSDRAAEGKSGDRGRAAVRDAEPEKLWT
jgi:hypothetical protein